MNLVKDSEARNNLSLFVNLFPEEAILRTLNLRESIISLITAQGYAEGAPWAYKGAKMCLFWPIWNRAFPDAKWIIVRRKSEDIAHSCVNTSFMKAYGTERGWMGWIESHLERFEEMKAAMPGRVFEIWSDQAVQDLGKFENMIEWLELDYDYEQVAEFVDPSLLRRRSADLRMTG